MRVLLVANPASAGGRGRSRARAAEAALRREGARVDVLLTARVGHAREALAAPPREVDRVVACGGDGLVSEAAAALRGSDLPLALLPAGRGNDLARALAIPLDLDAAARLAVHGLTRRMDLGVAGGRVFCTALACGIDAEVSRRGRTAPWPLPGPGTYVVETLRALVRFPGVRVRLEADGRIASEDAWLAAVANAPCYGGGFRVAPQARMDDGLLDACILRKTSRTRALALFPRVLQGRHVDLPEVVMMRAESFVLSSEPPSAVEADGEPIAATPVRISCERGALAVVAAT